MMALSKLKAGIKGKISLSKKPKYKKNACLTKEVNKKFEQTNLLGMGFGVTIDGDISASWGSYKLIWHPNHGRN